jgi:hypothetical protein
MSKSAKKRLPQPTQTEATAYRAENLRAALTNIVQARRTPTVVVPVGPCLPGRISAPKGQDMVKEARQSTDHYFAAHIGF